MKIAIIGAGFGGMAAAYDLRKAGHEVTIFESADYVGGSLREQQLSGYIETWVLSCNAGTRKPGAAIMLEAARQMQIDPARCAYVGDRLNRDVEAAQKARYGKVILR